MISMTECAHPMGVDENGQPVPNCLCVGSFGRNALDPLTFDEGMSVELWEGNALNPPHVDVTIKTGEWKSDRDYNREWEVEGNQWLSLKDVQQLHDFLGAVLTKYSEGNEVPDA